MIQITNDYTTKVDHVHRVVPVLEVCYSVKMQDTRCTMLQATDVVSTSNYAVNLS